MTEIPDKAFQGINVAVIGGSAGIGRQYCIDLGKLGANVLVVGRSALTNTVTEEIVARGGVATACLADAREGAGGTRPAWTCHTPSTAASRCRSPEAAP